MDLEWEERKTYLWVANSQEQNLDLFLEPDGMCLSMPPGVQYKIVARKKIKAGELEIQQNNEQDSIEVVLNNGGKEGPYLSVWITDPFNVFHDDVQIY